MGRPSKQPPGPNPAFNLRQFHRPARIVARGFAPSFRETIYDEEDLYQDIMAELLRDHKVDGMYWVGLKAKCHLLAIYSREKNRRRIWIQQRRGVACRRNHHDGLAKIMERELFAKAGEGLSPKLKIVLAGMLHGFPNKVTAKAIGCSVPYLERMRHQVREFVGEKIKRGLFATEGIVV